LSTSRAHPLRRSNSLALQTANRLTQSPSARRTSSRWKAVPIRRSCASCAGIWNNFSDYPFHPETDHAEHVLDALRAWGTQAFNALFDSRDAGKWLDNSSILQVRADDPHILSWPSGSFSCALSESLRFIRERVQSLYVAPERQRRNVELQRMVQAGAASLEIQEQELQRAREIQQSLLPKEIPQLPGIAVATAWRPAREPCTHRLTGRSASPSSYAGWNPPRQ
jgi:hypothetical protein